MIKTLETHSDSLSPLNDHVFFQRVKSVEGSGCLAVGLRLPTEYLEWRKEEVKPTGATRRHDAHAQKRNFQRCKHEETVPCTTTTPPLAWPPRFVTRQHLHRPTQLYLATSNGFTATTTADLKLRIRETRSSEYTAVTQVPLDNRTQLPPTPTTPIWLAMGNQHSRTSGAPVPDDRSQRSVVRRSSRPIPRKSSYNVFRRVDSRSPLPRDATASALSVAHPGAKDDDTTLDDDGQVEPIDPLLELDQPDQEKSRYPKFRSHVRTESATTVTNARAAAPLSPASTIRDVRSTTDDSWVEDFSKDGSKDGSRDSDEPPRESSPDDDWPLQVRSPTIPALLPLPEDSPHKYGLRDKIDTPDLPEKAVEINLTKPRRMSSGVELFREIGNLQSASSFLNGLSTSRRRAASANDTRPSDTSSSSWTNVTGSTSETSSSGPTSISTNTSPPESRGRRPGYNFKASGFAYSRPLEITQLNCYRSHARLLVSRNKHAPVECAVCHIDDDGDHFSCSWCATRMCKYCKKDFRENGLPALRERIKKAELGGSENGSSEASR